MPSSPEQLHAFSTRLQASLARFPVITETRFVDGCKPRIVMKGDKGAVVVHLTELTMSRPVDEVAYGAAVDMVRRRVWA